MSRSERQSGTIRWGGGGEPSFCGGEGALVVPMSMHRGHRERLCERLRARPECADAVVFLAGGDERSMYDTDVEWDLFRQESNFQYLFGVKEPGCLGFIRVSDARCVLLVPELDASHAVWLGPIKPAAWFHKAYAVDEVAYVGEAAQVAEGLGAKTLITYQGTNRDSGLQLESPKFEGVDKFTTSAPGSAALYDELGECRVVKSKEEVRIMQYVNDVSSLAHLEVMRVAKGGQREYISEATFRYQSMLRACKRVGYTCICPAGPRNAYLHYGHPAEPNAELLESGALTLHDMGAEYHCYTADVTITFPSGGTFTESQRLVYEAVWMATQAVEASLRPGVCYKEMHRLAQRTLLTAMKQGGLFIGEVEDMMLEGIAGYFMPHGLGHSVGLDVHDVAGYAPGVGKKDDPTIKENLRLGRELKENMVITVEPGFYFNDYSLQQLASCPEKMRFVDPARLEELKSVGGVRIEDDVIITEKGCRVLTCLPRSVEEIEAFMAGQEWVVSQANCREYTAPAPSL